MIHSMQDLKVSYIVVRI